MIRYMPKGLQVLYLTVLALAKGDAAADTAVRDHLGGLYPADMDPTYEPKPLPGFAPLRNLDTERHFPPTDSETELAKALDEGDWRTAASQLDATWQHWNDRSYLVHVLAKAALPDDAWLTAWEQAEPANPGAKLVRADRTVRYAWELRSAKFARYLSHEQVDGFLTWIARAEEAMTAAVEAAPEDPTGYERMIRIAYGRSWSHEAMNELWAEFTGRNPHGFEGHFAALQYWCAKWRGSDDKAREFAAAAAENAPEGTFLNALPLIAAYEEHGLTAEKEYRTPAVSAAIDACLAELAAHGDANPPVAFQVRHLLAFLLNRAGRHAEAVEQFRVVDGHINSMPWTYFPNKVQEYGWHRRDSFRRSRR